MELKTKCVLFNSPIFGAEKAFSEGCRRTRGFPTGYNFILDLFGPYIKVV